MPDIMAFVPSQGHLLVPGSLRRSRPLLSVRFKALLDDVWVHSEPAARIDRSVDEAIGRVVNG